MSEEAEIKRDGARPHRNSGRGILEKADASLGPFCIDYKEYNESFGVSRNVWAKIQKDAFTMNGQPALKLVLGQKDSTHKVRLWVIDDGMFKEMLDAWEQLYGTE